MRVGLIVALLLALAGCRRSEPGVAIKPAFSDDSVVGRLTTSWSPTQQSRQVGGAEQQQISLRVDALNELSEGLYIRFSNLRVVGADAAVDPPRAPIPCVLPPGATSGALHATAWVPRAEIDAIRSIDVDYFAVPLSERGRAFYREFLRQQRPGDVQAIDAEIAAYAAAPPCTGAGG